MKRKDLEALGLEKEVVDKIMDMNGSDIEAEKSKTRAAEQERDKYKDLHDTATAELEKFKDADIDGLKGQIEKLQGDLRAKDDEYAAKEAERVFHDTLSEAIKTAGGRNAKSIMALLNVDELKASKNQGEDIKKALDTVKESDAYLFGSDEPFLNPVGATGGAGGAGSTDPLASVRAAMGLPTEKK